MQTTTPASTGTKAEVLTGALIIGPAPILGAEVEVVSVAVIEGVKRALQTAEDLVVDSDEAYQRAAEHLNNFTKFTTTIKKQSLDAGRPYRDHSDLISDTAKEKVLHPLSGGATTIELKMMAYKKKKDEERARIIAEQQAAARKAQEEQRAVLAAKEKLEREAKLKEEQAAQRMEAAGDSAKKMENAIKAGEAAQALREEAEAVPVPFVPEAHITAPVPEELKAKGVKMKKTPIIHSHDLALLPITYHMLDEVKVKKHILDGTITIKTPGITFEIKESVAGTGR